MIASNPITEKEVYDYQTLNQYFKVKNQKKFASLLKNISDQITYNENKRILFIVPQNAGDVFLSTSLLRSLKEIHSPCDIYFSCKKEFFLILDSNPYIHKVIEYNNLMDNQLLMEGFGDWPGLFDVSIFVPIFTQKFSNWINNGKSKIAFNLFYNKNASN